MSITRRKLMVATVALAGLPIVAEAADPEEGEFLAVFRQLSEKQRAMIQIVARHFADLPIPPELDRRARP